ncbi:MAG TPA: ABC transporter permease subunit [Candidatus Acidoferrales bacterium]|nr:ABC transporter permease subunit [Candidatus Acidoferrales bacterium]
MSKTRAIQVATLIVILGIYEMLSRSGRFYQGAIPPLGEIGRAFVVQLAQPDLYLNLWVTAYEVVFGFAIAMAVGVLLGIVLGAAPLLGTVVAPFIDSLATTPKIIFLPIAMLLVGTGPPSKVLMAALSAIFPVMIAVAAGMRQINPVLIRVGRSFRCSWWQMVTKIYMPSLSQPIVSGARLGFGLCIVITLLSEIKISKLGLGFLTIDAYNHYQIPQMYALLLLIFVIAVGTNALISRLASR